MISNLHCLGNGPYINHKFSAIHFQPTRMLIISMSEVSAMNCAQIIKLVFETSSLRKLIMHRHTDRTDYIISHRLAADN